MTPRRVRVISLKWTATALAAAALLGCGGGAEDAASNADGPTSVVQVTAIAAGLKVTASATGAGAPDQTVRESTQFSFSASLASGTHAGQSLAGTLILKGADANGITEVEGVLLPATGTAALNAAALARAAALQEELTAAVLTLRTTLRADIESMSAVLRDAMAAGAGSSASPTAAQSQALAQFTDAFTAVNARYRSEVAALNAQALAKVGALSATQKDGDDDDGEGDDDDDSDDDDEGGGAPPLPGGDIAVVGTIDAQGRVDLRLKLSDQTVISAVGQAAADGSLSGTLSGPDSTDQGTWTAGAVAMPAPPAPTPPTPPPASPPPPPPPPPAAPVGDATAGLAKYTNFCASCHTDNVRRNVLNVTGASTLNGLNAANSSVGVMRFLGTAMSAQDKLDVVAYINSAK